MLKKSLIIAVFYVASAAAQLPVTVQEAGLVGAAVHNTLHASPAAYCFNDNFRIGIEGTLYRANTLPPAKLSRYIEEYGLKSIVNLRGELPEKQWWQDEKRVCDEHGIDMYNVELLAHEYPPPSELKKLFEIFDTATPPLMVHCFAGVDRTGTASALWFLEKEGRSLQEALHQLNFFYYGHWGWIFGQPMRKFVKLWGELREQHSRDDALEAYTQAYHEQNLRRAGREHRYNRPVRMVKRKWHYPIFALLYWQLDGKIIGDQ